MITPKIESLAPKKFVGKHLIMSMAQNRTGELWQSFMKNRASIKNAIGADRYSLQFYPSDFFMKFDPMREFEKWALVEVEDFNAIPEGMESLEIEGGLYAVFDYVGDSRDTSIFEYIFSTWLPQSGYKLDNRAHFEVLGEKYKNNDPSSQEEIWVPIKK